MAEIAAAFDKAYLGRRVLVTGHTGFKGSWLALWLGELGAVVAGYSREELPAPSHARLIGANEAVRNYFGDVRDAERFGTVLDEFRPDIVFHLAAQAIVGRSYEAPSETFTTNAIGTLNVLESVRSRPEVRAVVLITSDKVYRNEEWAWGYREVDALGGRDPYSASKACAELICHAYFESFIAGSATWMATTRAGNVIGGGDWAPSRIVPDAVRAWSRDEVLSVRSPSATRPWQHVLEPLSGYLWLGARLLGRLPDVNGEAFNFGPDGSVNATVAELLTAMCARWEGAMWRVRDDRLAGSGKEAQLLKLACDKAQKALGWTAVLGFSETVQLTVDWYRAWHQSRPDMRRVSTQQIASYSQLSSERGAVWAPTADK